MLGGTRPVIPSGSVFDDGIEPRPGEDDAPFEYKASDWGRLKDGRLVALDYSTPAHLTKEDLEELLCAATWPE
jgi:hypothetical protein